MNFPAVSKRCLILIAMLLFSAQSFAGAFQLWEESASSLGDYHAGAAAEANNASTIFYNPAGMSRIKHQQVSLGAVFIDLGVNYRGDIYLGTPPLQTASTSGNGASGDTFNTVPNFHYVLPINNRWTIGIDETTPFGLSTDYSRVPDNNVKLLATKTELQTININPSVSYLISRDVAVGVGVDILHGEAIYDDNSMLAPITNELTGFGYGYNAGILYEMNHATRIGLSYRSPITIDARGPSETNGMQSTVSADFPLPATTMLSWYHDWNQKLAFMASVFYTQWSCFHELVLHNMAIAADTVGNVGIYENYRDTWNIGVGSRYQLTHKIAVEVGAGHDETPTRIGYRDIRLPDGDRYALALGLNIHQTKNFRWNIGWTHFFLPTVSVDNTQSVDTQKTTSIITGLFGSGIGSARGNVNVFGVQCTLDI